MDIIEKISIYLAWKMPKQIVYWCAIRLFCNASKEYSNQVVSEISVFDALEYWQNNS